MSDSSVASGQASWTSRALSLGYHDVVERLEDLKDDLRAAPANYALERPAFREHLKAILERTSRTSVRIISRADGPSGPPVFLTFDDGAVGAYDCIAPELEQFGWRGHFFIVSDWIGKPGFMSAPQLRDLHQRGHVIGSHSRSHPTRISHLNDEDLAREWTDSVALLSQILGEPVTTGSIPNGYYTDRVASAAANAGIRVLFNSAPTATSSRAEGLIVMGRYAIYADTPASVAGALAAGSNWPRWRQTVLWHFKKGAKSLGGETYLKLRRQVLRRGKPRQGS